MRQGDSVEVHGLNSDAGKHMNGMHGVVLSVDTGTGRAIVRLGGTKKSIKVTNLRAPESEPESEPVRRAQKLAMGAAGSQELAAKQAEVEQLSAKVRCTRHK